MKLRPVDLRSIPLFAGIAEEHLGELLGIFELQKLDAGATLLRVGDVADRLILLVRGEVAVDYDGERIVLRPIAPVGELGALLGLGRSTTAVTTEPSEILSVRRTALLDFLERHGDVAFPLQHNLLILVADKLARDRQRMEEMRHNLIATQKGMKRMRDALLEAEDTPLHRMLFEELDALIEANKKGHYVVEGTKGLQTVVRLDDGTTREVLRLSNERLYIPLAPGPAPAPGSDFSAVLVMPGSEIPVTGTVETTSAEAVAVVLDLLIDEYAQVLERHLARLRLLDVVL